MATSFTDSELELMLCAVTVESWYISAENLVDAGSLTARGYFKAVDGGYDGPQIVPTEKAREALLARGLIEWADPKATWRGWVRTAHAPRLTAPPLPSSSD